MKNNGFLKKSVLCARLAAAVVSALGVFCPPQSMAQVPARFYWKSLSGGNGVPLILESISGNTNPFDSSHAVTAGAEFDATLALLGFAHNFSLFDRSAMAAVIMPMGRVSGEVTVAGSSTNQSAAGFGDPMLEFVVNLLGPPAQKTIPDAVRYEPGFSVDFLADLALPIGEYDNDQSLNIGQNRWYGRIGMPIVWQLGPWVPGRRTTLEFLPAMWFFSDNDDYVGQTMETDLLFQLDAHLTRDLTEKLWGSLDAAVYNGGAATINGVSGEELSNFGMGVTLGYVVNDNLNLTFSYKPTLNDNAPDDLRMDVFMATLVFGYHPIIEGSRRLQASE